MRYAELNLFGVYVSPFLPMMAIAWALTWPLRRLADQVGLQRLVWHPALFNLSVYLMLLSAVAILWGLA